MDIDLSKGVSSNIILLKIIGHWSFGNKKLYNIYKQFVIISMILYNLAGLMNLLKNLDDAEEVSATSFNLISTVGVMLKINFFHRNVEDVEHIVDTFQVQEFQPRNKEQRKFLKSGIFLANFVFYYFFISAQFTLVMWIIFPILDNERRLPSKAWFPYDYLSTKYYTITYTWQSIFICYHAFSNIALDTLFAMLMIQVGAQCDVLNNEVSTLGAENSDDPEALQQDLHRCIHHHRLILGLSQSIQLAFGNLVVVQFATSVMVLCETMFVLSLIGEFNATFVMLLFYQLSIFTEIFLYCWFGNEVVLKSEKLNYSAYLSNWYNCPLSFKRNLLFFMHRAQKPIVLVVGNMFPITLMTFTSILRSSWAYFAALRKVHDNSEINAE